jgi:hypothetical protein
MEKKWKLVVIEVLVIALVLIASVAILYKPNSATPSQKAMLAPSDMPEQGWREVDFIDQPLVDTSTEDCWQSQLGWFDSRGDMAAAVFIELYHFNSSEAALAGYDSRLTPYSITNGTTVEQVSVGDGGFTVKDSSAVVAEGKTSQMYFVKGSYVSYIKINWDDSYDGSYKDVVQIAKIQAEKLS